MSLIVLPRVKYPEEASGPRTGTPPKRGVNAIGIGLAWVRGRELTFILQIEVEHWARDCADLRSGGRGATRSGRSCSSTTNGRGCLGGGRCGGGARRARYALGIICNVDSNQTLDKRLNGSYAYMHYCMCRCTPIHRSLHLSCRDRLTNIRIAGRKQHTIQCHHTDPKQKTGR